MRTCWSIGMTDDRMGQIHTIYIHTYSFVRIENQFHYINFVGHLAQYTHEMKCRLPFLKLSFVGHFPSLDFSWSETQILSQIQTSWLEIGAAWPSPCPPCPPANMVPQIIHVHHGYMSTSSNMYTMSTLVILGTNTLCIRGQAPCGCM